MLRNRVRLLLMASVPAAIVVLTVRAWAPAERELRPDLREEERVTGGQPPSAGSESASGGARSLEELRERDLGDRGREMPGVSDSLSEERPDPTGDLAHYRASPMSEVPHVVVRGWGVGARSKQPGAIGAVVIVEPGLDEDSVERLARDIRAYHLREDSVSIRVMDDPAAALYDRHSDGGLQAEARLVARIVRNDRLEVDEIRVGERVLDLP